MTVNRSYANDLISFGGSDKLKELINSAFDAAIDNLNQKSKLVPMALTNEDGQLVVTVIMDDSNRSTEEVASAMIKGRSRDIDMYAVCYAADVREKSTNQPMKVVVVIAAERGAPYGYRIAQAYQRKLLGGVKRTNAPFLMGKVGQFIADAR